jgi:hypothetical protein
MLRLVPDAGSGSRGAKASNACRSRSRRPNTSAFPGDQPLADTDYGSIARVGCKITASRGWIGLRDSSGSCQSCSAALWEAVGGSRQASLGHRPVRLDGDRPRGLATDGESGAGPPCRHQTVPVTDGDVDAVRTAGVQLPAVLRRPRRRSALRVPIGSARGGVPGERCKTASMIPLPETVTVAASRSTATVKGRRRRDRTYARRSSLRRRGGHEAPRRVRVRFGPRRLAPAPPRGRDHQQCAERAAAEGGEHRGG